jgi:hypothetical protein
MSFTVPCGCGRSLRVSGAQAGSQVRCECGQDVAVPSLGELRRAEPTPTARRVPGGQGDPAAIRILGVALIVIGLLVPFALLEFPISLVGTAVWTAGGFLITRSKGYSVAVSLLIAFLCPALSVAVLFFPDHHG